jgi:anhydro-N-acetylmuramic acid kinase
MMIKENFKTGLINLLLNELNNLDFYQQTHPKSLGFEFVKQTVIPIIEPLKST